MTENESWRNVGKRIRRLRKANGLSLKQLAAGCELSANAISLVERGEVAPTVLTLCKIAHALGVSVGSFFQELCAAEVIVTRAADLQPETQPAYAAQALINGDSFSPVSARDGFSCALSGQITQKVHCVCGSLEFLMDDQSYVLYPGDSLAFNSDGYHRWKNAGAETGVAVMVLLPENRSSDPGV